MNNDFQYVTRPRKSKSRAPKTVPTSPTLATLATTFESIQFHFSTTPLCSRCKDVLGEVLGRLEKPERIICLGLGSLESDPRKISFVQLALLMELQQILKISVTIYDPIFTELDKDFLVTLGIQVNILSQEDYIAEKERTLFYLPHCDRITNESVLETLLSTASLEKSILLGNDLRTYDEILPDAKLLSLAPSIYKIIKDGLMEYWELEPDQEEEYWDAFSDLCLMAPKAAMTTTP